ncbi:MAG: hypothetical protein CM15mP74_09240 [Halieaceae bacterium]|nr:MAG: hypothetical protein CM15mP74_09240 [Halieaceae bacterium]
MDALVFERVDLAVGSSEHNLNAGNLDALNFSLGEFVRKQRRIPVIHKSPVSIHIGLVLFLHGIGVSSTRLGSAPNRLLIRHIKTLWLVSV